MPRDRAPDPRSGLDERGEWSPAFPGQRSPLEPGHEHRVGEGNTLSLQHGAYSVLALERRAAELRPALEADLPPAVREGGFSASIDLAALALARAEAAANGLAAMDPGDERVELLDRRLGRWIKSATQALEQLGATPRARAALGLDLAAAERDRAHAELLERGRQIREQRAATIAEAGEEAGS